MRGHVNLGFARQVAVDNDKLFHVHPGEFIQDVAQHGFARHVDKRLGLVYV